MPVSAAVMDGVSLIPSPTKQVARLLVSWQRLSCYACFVDIALASGNDSVRRDLPTCFHEQQVACLHLVRIDHLPAVAVNAPRNRGRKLRQRLDGASGFLHCLLLQPRAELEQERNNGDLAELADGKGTYHGNADQAFDPHGFEAQPLNGTIQDRKSGKQRADAKQNRRKLRKRKKSADRNAGGRAGPGCLHTRLRTAIYHL